MKPMAASLLGQHPTMFNVPCLTVGFTRTLLSDVVGFPIDTVISTVTVRAGRRFVLAFALVMLLSLTLG
jgi:hypothetical protein